MKAEGGKTDSSFIRHPSSFSALIHRLALVNAAATLPLLFIGALVTSKGVGLAVPDWPTTFGYPMFLYPWSEMIGGVLYEHSHRLVASGVGLLTLALAFRLWFYERRRWLRYLGVAALGLVILQGVIGGLRVIMVEEALAILHACLAQVFFALAVSLALFTSREWSERPPIRLADGGRLWRLCLFTTVLIYLQVFFGALLRFTGARLDLHLLVAVLIAVHVALLCRRILVVHSDQPRLARPALLMGGLLILQLALGLGSYLGRFTPLARDLPVIAVEIVRTSHVVTGALMLAISLMLTLRSRRWLAPAEPARSEEFLSHQVSA